MDKKGQLQNLDGFIIGLVLAAVILVMGLIMTSTLQDTIDEVTYTVTNASFNPMADNVNLTASESLTCDFEGFTITSAWNLSDGVLINSTCYTAYPNDGNFISVDCGDNFNDTHWNATYTYQTGDVACIAANKTTFGLGTFADFWEMIVLAIVVVVVLGLVMISFGKGKR